MNQNQINRERVKASSRAKALLAKKHKEEYKKLYRQECIRAGLSVRGDSTSGLLNRIAMLEAELNAMQQRMNEGV